MSFATANMESGSQPVQESNAIRRAPWLENQDKSRLGQHTSHPTSQLQLRFQHPFLPAPPKAWSADVFQQPQHLGRVDVLVQPASISSGKLNADKADDSKMKFSSPEDMAEMLFSSSKDTRNFDGLHQHRELSHVALLDHRDAIDSLLTHKQATHAAMMDHKDAIESLLTHKQATHGGMMDHKDAIESLLAQPKRRGGRSFQISTPLFRWRYNHT